MVNTISFHLLTITQFARWPSGIQITQQCDNEMIQDIHKSVSSFWLIELEVMNDDCPSFPNDPLGRLQSIVSLHEAWLPNHDILAVLLIGFRVPPCVQGKLEEIKTLHKKGRLVPIRSYLQLEFETVLGAIKKAGHVWWPSNSKPTD